MQVSGNQKWNSSLCLRICKSQKAKSCGVIAEKGLSGSDSSQRCLKVRPEFLAEEPQFHEIEAPFFNFWEIWKFELLIDQWGELVGW